MFKQLIASKFSPWIAGILIAVLFAFSLFILNGSVGTLEAYSQITSKINDFLSGKSVEITWQEFFLIGVFAGAVVAALSGKQFKFQLFPEDHLSKGPAYFLSIGLLINLIGGFLCMTGMIIAGETFLKMWNDVMGLSIIVFVFLIIVFIEAVIIGTFMTLKINIEEK